MALTDENGGGMVMPVAPLGYGGYGGQGGFGFGGDSLLWVILILCLGGGWGGFGGFGMGGAMMGAGMMGMDFLYPWLNNSQNINDGFRDQQLSTQVGGIQNAITSGFGDIQTALCGGFAGVNQNVAQGFANTNLGMCQGFNGVNTAISGAQNALAQQMYTNQIADMERSFAAQTQAADCCCKTQSNIADVKYTIATEECATRNAFAMNTRDIIEATNRGNQAILDKLCALELDTVKTQLAQAQRENIGLQNAVNMATMQASQTAQTAQILAGQAAEIDGVYNRLKNCPVPSMPVYGNTPIFTCSGNNGGCGCSGSF